jgi:DNA-binding NarL/FixJ family response regulator
MAKLTTKMELRARIDKSIPQVSTAKLELPSLQKPPVVLGIGLPRAFALTGIEIRRPANDRAVIELLRQTEFDLLVVSTTQEDEKVWNLLRLVRRHWPALRWVLFSPECTDALEIQARSLGAICVTADCGTIEELANN